MRLFPLLQHLGLVGAAGPHPGSRGEQCSPLVHAGETVGVYRAHGSIALRPRSRPNPSPKPPRPRAFENLLDVEISKAGGLSTCAYGVGRCGRFKVEWVCVQSRGRYLVETRQRGSCCRACLWRLRLLILPGQCMPMAR